jgi:hypothetical protein
VTVTLPEYYPGATTAWQLVERRRLVARTQPAVDGQPATVDFGQLDSDEQWLVDRSVVSVTGDDDTAAAVRLYDGDVGADNLLDGSDRGGFDVAEYPTGLLVSPSSRLTAQWVGLAAGAVGTISVQVRIERRG